MAEVLVIDDNKQFELIYKRKLCRMSPNFSSSLKDAKKAIINKKYDLILLSESLLPKGKEDLSKFVEDLPYKVPVIILITGTKDRESLKELNGYLIINKCTNSEDFSKFLNQALIPKRKCKKLEMQINEVG